MQSRMDKYNTINSADNTSSTRTQRNKELYDKIKSSDIKRHDVDNNMSVIKDNVKTVDINKVYNFIEEKYGDSVARRSSFDIPEIGNTQEIDTIQDTKEYDINAILEKAKQGKNIDYSKERLKKVREAQYEILNNLDSELNKLSNVEQAREKRKAQEENLKHLIDTITQIELKNKTKDTTNDLDLLSDLMAEDDEDTAENFKIDDDTSINLDTIDITKELEDVKDEINNTMEVPEIEIPKEEEEKEDTTEVDTTKEIEDTTPDIVIGGVQEVQDTINNKVLRDQRTIDTNDKKDTPKKEHIEETLSKLDIDLSSYEDFNDINEKDKSSTVLRIIIFIVFIVLIIGAVVILDNLLGLDLLPF